MKEGRGICLPKPSSHRYSTVFSSVGGTGILSGFCHSAHERQWTWQIKSSRCVTVSRSRSNPGENSLKIVLAAKGSHAPSSALNK
jgi:hypothetical protein